MTDSLLEAFPDRESYDRALAAAVRAAPSPLDVVPALIPGYERPDYLEPIADVYVRAEAALRGEGPPVLALISAPPQSGKTDLATVSYAWILSRNPSVPLGWLSYGADLSRVKSRKIRDYARQLKIPLRHDSAAVDQWSTKAGGGLLAKGLAGAVIGMSGLGIITVDDPYGGKDKAYSANHRRWVRDQIKASVFSRRNPRTSVIVQHHRWALDDLIGWLSEEFPDLFEVIIIAAVDDVTGEPIVTLGGRTKAFYEEQKRLAGAEWWPLYMGTPRSRDGALFTDDGVIHYARDAAPRGGHTVIGVDFAYSTRKTSDWSVAVVLRRVDHRAYVIDLVRKQCSAPDFMADLLGLQKRYPGAPSFAYIGNEQGIIDFMHRGGVQMTALPARMDKVARAVSTAAAWNAGNILVPEYMTWAGDLVSELVNFGAGGHDDQVDALVAAHDHSGAGQVSAPLRRPEAPSRAWDGAPSRKALERLQQAANRETGRSPLGLGSSGGWRPGMGALPKKHGW